MIEKMQAGLTGDFRAMGNGKYLYYPEASPVILQLELMESDTLLVYCSFALDGSGLFLSSFITLLLTEDVYAVNPSPASGGPQLGCVTGSVSQTYFRFLPTEYASGKRVGAHKLAAGCIAFVDELKPISVELAHAASPSEERLPSCNLADFRIAHLIEKLDGA